MARSIRGLLRMVIAAITLICVIPAVAGAQSGEMGTLYNSWNEYVRYNSYGGYPPSKADVSWLARYQPINNYAYSFSNGVSVGILGDWYGNSARDQKTWVLDVSRGCGADMILGYVADRMQSGDTV